MDPPPLRNGTGAAVEVIPHFDDRDGSFLGVALIKQRFQIGRRGDVARVTERPDIQVADQPWDPDNPESSSIRVPSDLCLRKPSTDVIVVGSAISPYRQPVTEIDVHLRVGEIRKSIRAYGPRAWYRAGDRCEVSRPLPFDSVSVMWELAYGGADYETDPERPLEEPFNPNGTGLVADPSELDGTPAPRIEDPRDLISSSRSRPRRQYAGTYDEQWMEERMPLLPLDFDARFNQFAPEDQIAPRPLRGGERVEIVGMHEEGPVVFSLPTLFFGVSVQRASDRSEHKPQLDTVALYPNRREVEMTWRATVPLPRQSRRLRFVQVHEKKHLR